MADVSPGGKPPDKGTGEGGTMSEREQTGQACPETGAVNDAEVIQSKSDEQVDPPKPEESPEGDGLTTEGLTQKPNYHQATSPSSNEHQEWVKKMKVVAERKFTNREDNDLRPIIPLEKEAAKASFSKVWLAKHTAEKTLLQEFVTTIEKGKGPSRNFGALIRETTRVDYNPDTRRVTFILAEKATADAWHGKSIDLKGGSLKLLSPDKLEEDDLPTDDDRSDRKEKQALKYQIRVLTHDLTAYEVMQIMGCYGASSISRESLAESKAYDSNYFLVVFKSDRCPSQLEGVTHIAAGSASVFLHHFKLYQRIPCFSCYAIDHPVTACMNGDTKMMKYHREFTATLARDEPIKQRNLRNMNVEDRLQHLHDLAGTLGSTMQRLSTSSAKTPLLTTAKQEDNKTTQNGQVKIVVPAEPSKTQQPVKKGLNTETFFDPASLKKARQSSKALTNSQGYQQRDRSASLGDKPKARPKDQLTAIPNGKAERPVQTEVQPVITKPRKKSKSKAQRKKEANARLKADAILNAFIHGTIETAANEPSTTNSDQDIELKKKEKLERAEEKARKLAEEAAAARENHQAAEHKAAAAKAGFYENAGIAQAEAIEAGLRSNEEMDQEQLKENIRRQAARREELEALDLARKALEQEAETARKKLEAAEAKARKSGNLVAKLHHGISKSPANDQQETKSEDPLSQADNEALARAEVEQEAAAAIFEAQRRDINDYLQRTDPDLAISTRPVTKLPKAILKIIDTPANGNCLYGAIHATTCYEVEGEDIDYEYSGHDVQILKDRILSACQEHVKLEAEPGAGRMHLLRMRISELYPTETLDQLGINHVTERLIKHYDASSDILMMMKVRYIVLHVDERRYPLP
ncbi:hypothetical protein Poli38472_014595 [Pythium oligandrum]|uniref:OTU domain-containing protein n=1 Tax=Pythium oligandrum TaxID=41045 RepID=A0A8K1CP15_PYTOL|nr:hypothetical protein Poli38472_014595 [Pythium oligandrum]|eukprot:TMW66619.1 hypothetical protein Poli38472_014595 [Pythium oligandrum]